MDHATIRAGAKLAIILLGCLPSESQPRQAAAEPPPPVETAMATTFDVSSESLHVTYTASGPDGQPQLTFVNAAQDLTFVGAQVRIDKESDLGTLVSVTTWRTIDSGATSFTLIVPPVILASPDASANVTLLGISTMHHFSVVRRMNRGQRAGYSAVTLTGTAHR